MLEKLEEMVEADQRDQILANLRSQLEVVGKSTPLWAYLYICNHICTSGWNNPVHAARKLYKYLEPIDLPTPPPDFLYLPLLESDWEQMLQEILVAYPGLIERERTGRTVAQYLEETDQIARVIQYSILYELAPRLQG